MERHAVTFSMRFTMRFSEPQRLMAIGNVLIVEVAFCIADGDRVNLDQPNRRNHFTLSLSFDDAV